MCETIDEHRAALKRLNDELESALSFIREEQQFKIMDSRSQSTVKYGGMI
jgi:hypothetical protein